MSGRVPASGRHGHLHVAHSCRTATRRVITLDEDTINNDSNVFLIPPVTATAMKAAVYVVMAMSRRGMQAACRVPGLPRRHGRVRYRVRARNARIAAMRRITLTCTYKIEAVELRTIVIIIYYLSRAFYRYMRQTSST